MRKLTFKNISFGLFIIALILYFIGASLTYNMKYQNNELNNKINHVNEQTDNLIIKNNTTSSKIQADNDSNLSFNDNIYYLKKEKAVDQ